VTNREQKTSATKSVAAAVNRRIIAIITGPGPAKRSGP